MNIALLKFSFTLFSGNVILSLIFRFILFYVLYTFWLKSIFTILWSLQTSWWHRFVCWWYVRDPSTRQYTRAHVPMFDSLSIQSLQIWRQILVRKELPRKPTRCIHSRYALIQLQFLRVYRITISVNWVIKLTFAISIVYIIPLFTFECFLNLIFIYRKWNLVERFKISMTLGSINFE